VPQGVGREDGIDHNRGEKKFPYAKSRLTTVLGGMENVQLMALPQRLRNLLVALLAIAPERSYKEYLLDLMGNGELSSLPEFIYVADANVTRKQAAQRSSG
jgi:hypothetical protein